MDAPDTMASHTGTGSTFTTHSNSYLKANVNEKMYWSHPLLMCILSICFMILPPDVVYCGEPVASIRHALKEKGNRKDRYNLCAILGMLDSEKITFVPWTGCKGEGIPMRGCVMHTYRCQGRKETLST